MGDYGKKLESLCERAVEGAMDFLKRSGYEVDDVEDGFLVSAGFVGEAPVNYFPYRMNLIGYISGKKIDMDLRIDGFSRLLVMGEGKPEVITAVPNRELSGTIYEGVYEDIEYVGRELKSFGGERLVYVSEKTPSGWKYREGVFFSGEA